MEIEYMQQVVENPTLNDFTNEDLSIENIEILEQTYNNGNEFPKAVREFLFLAGGFNNIGFDDLGEGFDSLQKLALKILVNRGLKVERPIFIFDQLDESIFTFIYLDEDEDDPQTHNLDPYFYPEDEKFIDKATYTFTELVNESIRRKKNDIPF